MIFGFGKKKQEEEEEDQELDLILFQGALNGKDANLSAHARLAEVALIPTKELVTDALARRAETIRIDPKGDRAAITFLIDGVAYPGGRLSKQMASGVTQMLKLLSGLDPRQRRRPQSGGIKAEFDDDLFELSVETRPLKTGGERLTLRARNLGQELKTPEEIGFSSELKSKIRELTSQHQGVFLVCGPPRSGVTTTSFGVLRSIDAYLYSIYTIADMGGRDVPNVPPFEANPEDDLETTLNRIARVEADVVFLDPVKNAEMAKTLFNVQKKIALLSEFSAPDIEHGILKLIEWVGDPNIVAEGLQGLVTQKLIRLLCSECKEAYRPNPKIVKKVNLPPETNVLYRHFRPAPSENGRGSDEDMEPCDQCGGIGYYGQTAMFELLEMTESMRKLVAKKPSPKAIRDQMRKENMQTLQHDGLRLVAEGKTSLEELQRVFKAS